MTLIDQPQAVDVIASGIHDAKNSMFDALARIGIASQAIRDGRSDDALPALAETERAVVASAERLSKLLSAYRLARHENPVSMLPVDVRELLEDALLRLSADRRRDIVLEPQCGYDGFWVCDRELVTDCLVNALQNALRAARTKVRLEAAAAPEGLALTVADDGPGFPPELPEHADGTQSGVGLFIAHRIAQLHTRNGRRGHLGLENGGPLGGAVFRLVLP
jgi:signal transduction histidine kinase